MQSALFTCRWVPKFVHLTLWNNVIKPAFPDVKEFLDRLNGNFFLQCLTIARVTLKRYGEDDRGYSYPAESQLRFLNLLKTHWKARDKAVTKGLSPTDKILHMFEYDLGKLIWANLGKKKEVDKVDLKEDDVSFDATLLNDILDRSIDEVNNKRPDSTSSRRTKTTKPKPFKISARPASRTSSSEEAISEEAIPVRRNRAVDTEQVEKVTGAPPGALMSLNDSSDEEMEEEGQFTNGEEKAGGELSDLGEGGLDENDGVSGSEEAGEIGEEEEE